MNFLQQLFGLSLPTPTLKQVERSEQFQPLPLNTPPVEFKTHQAAFIDDVSSELNVYPYKTTEALKNPPRKFATNDEQDNNDQDNRRAY